MPTHVFIGGLRDGQKIEVPDDRRFVELPIHGDRPPAAGKKLRRSPPVATEIYERMCFSGETESYHVFALKGLNGNVVMRALIDGYVKHG